MSDLFKLIKDNLTSTKTIYDLDKMYSLIKDFSLKSYYEELLIKLDKSIENKIVLHILENKDKYFDNKNISIVSLIFLTKQNLNENVSENIIETVICERKDLFNIFDNPTGIRFVGLK